MDGCTRAFGNVPRKKCYTDIDKLSVIWWDMGLRCRGLQMGEYADDVLQKYVKHNEHLTTVSDVEYRILAEDYPPSFESTVCKLPKLSSFQLHDKFWNSRWQLYYKKKSSEGNACCEDVMKARALSSLQLLGLKYSTWGKSFFPNSSTQVPIDDETVEIGMTEKNENGEIVFISPSLADYFAAVYYVGMAFDESRPQIFDQSFFLKDLFASLSYATHFINALLEKRNEIPAVEITKEQVNDIFSNLENIISTGYPNILAFFLNCLKKYFAKFPAEERQLQVREHFDDWILGQLVHETVKNKHLNALALLLNFGASLGVVSKHAVDHLYEKMDLVKLMASTSDEQLVGDVLKYSKQHGVKYKTMLHPNESGGYLLDHALLAKNKKLSEYLVNLVTENELDMQILLGPLALENAILLGSQDLIQRILTAIEALWAKGKLLGQERISSPLHSAITMRNHQAVTALCNLVNKNVKSWEMAWSKSDGQSPLHVAVYRGGVKVVKAIVEGAQTEQLASEFLRPNGKQNRSPIHVAAADWNEEMMTVLLEYAANFGKLSHLLLQKDHKEHTPLSLAVQQRGRNIPQLIVKFALEQKITLEDLCAPFLTSMDSADQQSLLASTDPKEIVDKIFESIDKKMAAKASKPQNPPSVEPPVKKRKN